MIWFDAIIENTGDIGAVGLFFSLNVITTSYRIVLHK